MSAKQVRAFYADLLGSLNVHDVGDGLLTLKFPVGDGEYSEKPCTSNGKRLTLPTDALIRNGKWEGLLAFHPLSENLLRGESEVLKFIRTMVRFRLSSTASQLFAELMGIAADPSRHKDLKPTQAEFLKSVQHANDKTETIVNTKLLTRHFDDLLNIYLKRGGQFKGEEYRRVAAVSFPIWDELKSKGKMIYDIDCGSVKNKKTIASLFEFIFPKTDDQNYWSAASNETVAPYFQALMQCYAKVAKHLNSIVKKYKKHLQYPEMLTIPLDWEDGLQHLSDWKALIAPLPGNEGATMKGEREADSAAQVAAAKPRGHSSFVPPVGNVADQRVTPDVDDTPPWEEQPAKDIPKVASPYAAPAAAEAPKETSTGKVNWRDYMKARQQAPTPPPAIGGYGQPAPMPQPFSPPAYPGYQNQGYPQQRQQWGGQPGYQPQGGAVFGGSL
jgi:hypothetical protein